VRAQAGTDLVDADRDRLRMVLGDREVDLKLTRECQWPMAFGGADVRVAFSGGLLELGPLKRESPELLYDWKIGSYGSLRPRWCRRCVTDSAGKSMPVPPVTASNWTDMAPAPDHTCSRYRPGERRNIDTDYEYLGGTLRCTVREWGRTIFDGTSNLAGLEIGSRPSV
jgi:tocopherol cyclase